MLHREHDNGEVRTPPFNLRRMEESRARIIVTDIRNMWRRNITDQCVLVQTFVTVVQGVGEHAVVTEKTW